MVRGKIENTPEPIQLSALINNAIREFIQVVDKSDVTEVIITYEGFHLALRKSSAISPEEIVTTPTLAASSPPVEERTKPIVAQLVGIFHRGTKPKAPPLVDVGDTVRSGDVVATIQSMKVMTDVVAPFAGKVKELIAHEGQVVEYGQPLILIESL